MLSALETYFRATSRRARHSAHVYCGRRQRLFICIGARDIWLVDIPLRYIDEKEKTPRQVLIPTSHLSEKAPGVPSKLQLSSRTLAIPAPSGLYLLYSNTFLKESHGYGQILEIYLNATALLDSYCMRFSARSIAKHINAAYTELETLTVPPTRNFLSPSPEVPIWRVDVRRELE